MKLDDYESIGTHWIVWQVNNNNVMCFDGFGVEHIPKEIKKFIGNKMLQQIFVKYKHMIK